MKEKNQFNTKNETKIISDYKPAGQITEKVRQLIQYSKEGDLFNLNQLLDNYEFQDSTLNLALRNIIQEYRSSKAPERYIECMKSILNKNIDLKYKYEKENNSTVLMMIFRNPDTNLIQEFLGNINIRANDIYKSNDDKIQFEINEKEKILTQKDDNNNSFLQLAQDCNFNELFNSFEYIYDYYPNEISPKPEIAQRLRKIIKNLLMQTNNEGNNFMNLCLENGISRLVLKLISILGYIPNINMKKNNYVHTAISGKKLSCLKIVLYYCNNDELNMKNYLSLTPAQYAMKLGYSNMANIINEYQKNFNDKEYKEHFYSNIEIYENKTSSNLPGDLLNSFKEKKYIQLFYELNEFKIINNFSSDYSINEKKNEDLMFRISDLKLQWNILMTKIKISEEKKRNELFPFHEALFDVFENDFNDNFILSYIEIFYDADIDNKGKKVYNQIDKYSFNLGIKIEILIYNKIIFYFKYLNYNSLVKTASIYLTKLFSRNNYNNIKDNKISFILFVNLSFILVETFIAQDYINITELIMASVLKYLFQNSQISPYIDYSHQEVSIFNYLNESYVLNQKRSSFDEIFCYENFLKVLVNKDKTKECFSHINNIYNNSLLSKDRTIFDRINLLFACMQIRQLYVQGDKKIYDKLSFLKNFNKDGDIFYLNSVGIIYLKSHKYQMSKLYFKQALNKYINMLKNTNKDNKEKVLSYRTDYITSFLYNISLCHFYLKDYNKCMNILEKLLNISGNKKKYFFYYRLGLCYLELYIESSKYRTEEYFSKNILKIKGYSKSRNKSGKTIHINIGSQALKEKIKGKLEVEHKLKEFYKNKFSKIKESIIFNANINKSKNNDNFLQKSIILKNTTKLMNTKNNSNTNQYINYIDKAIECFKNIILISKKDSYSDIIESIYDFYYSYYKEDTDSDKSDNDILNRPNRKKIPNEFLISVYFNLLLCLSIRQKWTESLLMIKNLKNKKLNTNKIMEMRILLYELEDYINLGNVKKVKETINQLKGYKKIELIAFNKLNSDIIKSVGIKLYIYYTLTLFFIKEKNYREMNLNLNKILDILKEKKDIPYYIIDLLINAYIIKLNNEENLDKKTIFKYNNIILSLIKYKKTNSKI